MAVATAFYVAALAIGAASSAKAASDRKKARQQAASQAAADLALRKKLASKVTAPTVKEEAQVDLESEEALEEAAILKRSKKGRLKVQRSTGTGGLSVG